MTEPKSLKQFILIGSPVAHSLSPILHNLFAAQFGFEINYKTYEATANNYLDVIYKFIDQGGLGLNITAPLKTILFKNLQYADKYALRAQAVNTVTIHANGTLHGYNTDGIGLLRDLKRNSIPITDGDILILGAGGAVRGILEPLVSQSPKSIKIVNRDSEKAKQVANAFKDLGAVTVIEQLGLHTIKPTVIINATIKTPEYIYKLNFNNTFCYDLNYTQKITEFMKFAQIRGAMCVIMA